MIWVTWAGVARFIMIVLLVLIWDEVVDIHARMHDVEKVREAE